MKKLIIIAAILTVSMAAKAQQKEDKVLAIPPLSTVKLTDVQFDRMSKTADSLRNMINALDESTLPAIFVKGLRSKVGSLMQPVFQQVIAQAIAYTKKQDSIQKLNPKPVAKPKDQQ